MPPSDGWKLLQRYRQSTRVVAVVVSGAFAFPVLFVFGVALRELSKPPQPSIYAAPTAPPSPTPLPEPPLDPEAPLDDGSLPPEPLPPISPTDPEP